MKDTTSKLEQRIVRAARAPGGLALGELSELAAPFGLQVDELKGACMRLVEQGVLRLRSGVLSHSPDPERALSPMGRQLLGELRRAGSEGLQLDRLTAAGAREQIEGLARSGLAVALDRNIYYARETYRDLAGKILAELAPGQRLSIGVAKERSGLSRKFIIPLLNRMETEGLVRREGDERVVIRLPGPEGASDARTSGTPAG